MKKSWPYLNHSLDNIKGEIWLPVPDFEEAYEVSDYGRVKSLERDVHHPKSGTQHVAPRILKQKVHVNKFTLKKGKPTVDLSVALSRNGQMKYVNVRRLVYSAFVEPIDFESDRLVVINVDGDGYDNSLSNISAVTESWKSQRMISRGRVNDFLKTADRSKWKKNTTNCLPVKQLSLNGKQIVAEYDSIKAATLGTGFDEKGISLAAHKRARQWGGYKWRFIPKRKKKKVIGG